MRYLGDTTMWKLTVERDFDWKDKITITLGTGAGKKPVKGWSDILGSDLAMSSMLESYFDIKSLEDYFTQNPPPRNNSCSQKTKQSSTQSPPQSKKAQTHTLKVNTNQSALSSSPILISSKPVERPDLMASKQSTEPEILQQTQSLAFDPILSSDSSIELAVVPESTALLEKNDLPRDNASNLPSCIQNQLSSASQHKLKGKKDRKDKKRDNWADKNSA
jgi:hypothetical protein